MNNIPDNYIAAFPWSHDDGEATRTHIGMSLRDYFAAKAMQALIAKYDRIEFYEKLPAYAVANVTGAYAYADAMLAARGKA